MATTPRPTQDYQARQTGICLGCGNENIHPDTARVFGDNDDCVPCCSECRDHLTHDYHNDARAIKGYRAGQGHWNGEAEF